VRFQYSLTVLATLLLSGCSSTLTSDARHSSNVTRYPVGDFAFEYPESLLTGRNSTECMKWSDSDVIAADNLFLFNAAGLTPVEAETLAVSLNDQVNKLALSMDWAPYKWLDSLPVVNQPKGAALFADSLVSLSQVIGTTRIAADTALLDVIDESREGRTYFQKTTEQVGVLRYVLPGFAFSRESITPSEQVYKQYLKLDRSGRVEAVRRYNRIAEYDVSSDPFEILPGRIMVCVFRAFGPGIAAEGHDLGINIKAGASDQDIRSALVAAYQSARTQSQGQLDSLVPEWFLTGQRQFHGGGRVASVSEGTFNSPIYSRTGTHAEKPKNYPALSALAYRYLGEANEMSLISSLLDSVRYRDMPWLGEFEPAEDRFFTEAFDARMRALDGGPISIRSFNYGWNGFIGTLR